ncbi:phage head completion protein [Candidatus Aquarickettsia rohweri]|uniref:Head-tail adaptor protein n=1 Tax=Candidatus Aquarickettsia rohweri TaxID=2602574 RepID=A0A3R9XSD3_9RICK|nr:head-tail adaptor protein [Candidatus Aquarickettsia rohweri]RST63736.1 hypothetical protein EIC27_05280 [Candidatus Aquarickettsia rohweri]
MIKNFSEMNQRVNLFTHDKIYDQYGGYIIDWKEYIKIWAKKELLEEDIKSKKSDIKKQALYKFTIRHVQNISLPLKLQCNLDNYFVNQIKQDKQNKKYMVLFGKLYGE